MDRARGIDPLTGDRSLEAGHTSAFVDFHLDGRAHDDEEEVLPARV